MIYCNGPRMHEFLREMNQTVLDKYDAMTVGELPHTPDPKQVLEYVGLSDKQLNMVFQFDIVDVGQGLSYKYQFKEWKLPLLKGIITKWQQFIDGTDGWTTAFCENHDQGRSVSRYASDAPEYRVKSAKMLSLMMSALTGTLFIYQGQEIGMINVPKNWGIEEYKDVESMGFYSEAAQSGDKERIQKTIEGLQILARDHSRIPFQWADTPNAGFTAKGKEPWMRTHDNYREINAKRQREDPESVLAFYKLALRLRKQYGDLFIHGAFRHLVPTNEALFAYVKESTIPVGGKYGAGKRKALVVMNFTSEPQECLDVPTTLACQESDVELLISTFKDSKARTDSQQTLAPWEGRVYLNFSAEH